MRTNLLSTKRAGVRVFALFTYINNTLARIDYHQSIEQLASLQAQYERVWHNRETVAFRILGVHTAWKYPQGPEQMLLGTWGVDEFSDI